ncbi:hypothetical protein HDE70_003289 [Pedobacter cryoconitis]|nr:hypothetical protein [Pedobacter cryoconitis]
MPLLFLGTCNTVLAQYSILPQTYYCIKMVYFRTTICSYYSEPIDFKALSNNSSAGLSG